MIKKYFKTPYSEFVYLRTYARWIPEKNRREVWPETVDRYVSFMMENLGKSLTNEEYEKVKEEIINLRVMPSMRLLQFAGEPARKTNVCTYNCSFTAPKSWECLSSILYILMCGSGVGFMVSRENVNKFPWIKMQEKDSSHRKFLIEDSKEGWADAFKFGLNTWASGHDVVFDYTKLRPAGARLKTFGGFSSGPAPLKKLLNFAREKILEKQGTRLEPIDVHDIICMIAEIVVCGGVRRSALISLSDLSDTKIRDCKKGKFWMTEPQRALSNNSVAYKEKPSKAEFLKEFQALIDSGSGERGIFNQSGILKNLPERRVKHLRATQIIEDGKLSPFFGTNPCAEILLQSNQFCNLSEVICRPDDTEESLTEKIKTATLLGTYQSSLTNYDYLPSSWEENSKSERLLGVSLTGMMDCQIVRNPKVLSRLRKAAIRFNKEYAKRIGINESTCITAIKPSGTVSQLVACSSGLHGNFSQYYIRRIRIMANDPLLKMAKSQGIPAFPEIGQSNDKATTWVLEFPQKAPEGAILQEHLNAMTQLTFWKVVKTNYTEHNPSVTIYVKPQEWESVANWVYDNFDMVGGLSFLPANEHIYELAPYEKIDKEEFKRRLKDLEGFDLSKLSEYEKTDCTQQKQELSCQGGTCES